MSIKSNINEIRSEFDSDFCILESGQLEYKEIFYKYLGRKGLIVALYPLLSTVEVSEKPKLGNEINSLKNYISEKLSVFESNLTSENNSKDLLDLSLPSLDKSIGSIHPITLIIDEIQNIFKKIGFSSIYGPEVDSDYYNFEALNIPKHHPARDMQDTFYTKDSNLLRTHTSGSQIHFMENSSPPIRILSPGRVYRNEDISVRSYCLFHQIEGLYVDEKVTFSDLKGTLDYFAKEFFGQDTKTRFRPSYFPFTEPSAEMDVYWGLENESDYRITKGTGWLEILGCGMVDPEVFKSVKIDPDKYKGYAFGLGIERIAMLKYGIEDIRMLFDGDIRFLRQFK